MNFKSILTGSIVSLGVLGSFGTTAFACTTNTPAVNACAPKHAVVKVVQPKKACATKVVKVVQPKVFVDLKNNFGLDSTVVIDNLAKAFGVSPATLLADLNKGVSIYQFAQKHGCDQNKLEQTFINIYKNQLDQLVKSKHLTFVQEQNLLNKFRSQVNVYVNETVTVTVNETVTVS